MDMYQKRKIRAEMKNINQEEKLTKVGINWYPGHMAKATRLIKEDLRNVDVVIKLCDARAVNLSENKDFNKVIDKKKVVYVFNKSDLAEEEENKRWQSYFRENKIDAFFVDALHRKGINEVRSYLVGLKKNFRYEREVKGMVIGIPNVGKSMFINALSKRSGMKTGNKPGVTRGNKWIKVEGEFYLLDTPGILPPKFSEEIEGMVLALIGSVKDTIFNREELALYLVGYLSENYPFLLKDRYKTEDTEKSAIEVYEDIARKRGFLLKGAQIDYERCAAMLLDEFKNGKIGKVSFDKVK